MNQRVMLTKRLIKESLIRLLKDRGVYNITVKELCAQSQINRSTFYTYYGCPRDVLLEIEQEAAKDIQKLWLAKYPGNVKAHLKSVCDYIYTNRETQRIIMKNNTDEDMAKTLTDAIIAFTIPQAYLGDDTDPDPINTQLTVTFLTTGMYSVLRKWILDGIEKSPSEIAEIMYKILFKQL